MEEALLEEHGIRPTAVRLLVVRILAQTDSPLSLSEIEATLDTAPKSTIFRALTLFETHKLVHTIEDGSGSLKYELSHHRKSIDDRHPHFFCEACQRTYCIKEIQIPTIELPKGFTMHSFNYIIKGICDKCCNKQEEKV